MKTTIFSVFLLALSSTVHGNSFRDGPFCDEEFSRRVAPNEYRLQGWLPAYTSFRDLFEESGASRRQEVGSPHILGEHATVVVNGDSLWIIALSGEAEIGSEFKFKNLVSCTISGVKRSELNIQIFTGEMLLTNNQPTEYTRIVFSCLLRSCITSTGRRMQAIFFDPKDGTDRFSTKNPTPFYQIDNSVEIRLKGKHPEFLTMLEAAVSATKIK